jgi:hypothetical protein
LPNRRRLLLFGGAAALQIPSIALAAFDFFRSEYSATRAELQAAMAKRFPLRQRYAELFTVTLRNPQLGLDPENNRLRVTALLAITSPLLQPPGVGGLVSVSSALRYDAPARTLRLDQPRADRIEIEGLSGRDGERLQQIGAVVAQELMQGQALHTFEAKDRPWATRSTRSVRSPCSETESRYRSSEARADLRYAAVARATSGFDPKQSEPGN